MISTKTAEIPSTQTHTSASRDVPPTEAPAAEPHAAQSPDAVARIAEGVIDTVVELGAVWVRHGIDLGRLIVRTHSEWLGGVSRLLGQVADAMERTDQPKDAQQADAAKSTE